jgi:membrane-associated protease RseP (regulator of RpoE activity)
MGLTTALLSPFRRFFRAPVLETPFSTIKIPPVQFLMFATFLSFVVITSGTVFCLVRGIGMTGYARGSDGKVFMSWIDMSGVTSQFGTEGLVAAMLFSASAASFISAIKVLRKPEREELTDWDGIQRKFAFSCPVWCYLSYLVFTAKVGSFRPKFLP